MAMKADAAREAAWVALFDPGTGAGPLSQIAQAYPEFAALIERHPNCHPALRRWLQENAAEYLTGPDAGPPVSTPEASAAPTHRWSWKVLGVLAGAGVVAVAAVTIWAVPIVLRQLSDAGITVPGMGGSQTGARALAGPPIYVGDELDWFLLSDEQLRQVAPGATDIKRNAHYESAGETEGTHPSKEGCWLADPYGSSTIVGVRGETWEGSSGPVSSISLVQFPSGDLADKYFREQINTVKDCPSFEMLAGDNALLTQETASLLIGSPTDDLVVISRSTKNDTKNAAYAYAFALEGNVVLSLYGSESDPKRLADLAQAQVTGARTRLVDKIGYR